MIKKFKENKYLMWGITLFGVIGASITLYFILLRLDNILFAITKLLKILTPIFLGILFAYLLNPAVRFFENKVFKPLLKKIKHEKFKEPKRFARLLGIFTTYIIACLFVFLMIKFVVPSLFKSIEIMISSIPTYLDKAYDFLKSIIKSNTTLSTLVDSLNTDITQYFTNIISPSLDKLMTNLTTGITNIVKGVINVIIGMIISVYLLYDKESFIQNTKKTLTAFLPQKIYDEMKTTLKYIDKIFGGFMIAKIIDASIVAGVTFIMLTIFRIPYALIISVIVGVTNVIPYFGPFLGAIPSALLLLLVNPTKCFTFVILIFLIQQFDGNILEPKLIGNKTGIKSFWVLFSILLFGGIFGFVGMIFGVPIFAIIYSMFSTWIDKKLDKKKTE